MPKTDMTATLDNVRLCHKADMGTVLNDVRFRG
jgi:hypothetical protein